MQRVEIGVLRRCRYGPPRATRLARGLLLFGTLACGTLAAQPGRAADPRIDTDAVTEDDGEVNRRIADAIARFRGHSTGNLSRDTEYQDLDASLEDARQVFAAHPAAAMDAIVPLLASETRDSFLIVELAAAVAAMASDERHLALAAAALERTDVKRHPAATVRALTLLGSRSCGPCLPAMFRVLELRRPRVVIPRSGLRLDTQDSVFLFVFGQYGEAALPGLIERLESKDCGVRSNAARALRWVRPPTIPPALRAMTLDSGGCISARWESWYVLGELDDPEMPVLALRRLDASPAPDGAERANIANGLTSSWVPTAMEVLKSMRDDPSPRVQPIVKSALSPDREMDTLLERIGGRPGAVVRPEDRERRLRALEVGARSGRYRMEEPNTIFIPSMTLEDIPLLVRTRSAVLRQLSEDSHLHAVRLTMAVRALRLVHAEPPVPLPPRVEAPPDAGTAGGRYRLPPDMEGYFVSRYGKEVRVVSNLKETPDGPHGTLSVFGLALTSPDGATRDERARSATLAFLRGEADLLGIRDFAEIRETRLKFDDTDRIERLRGACYVDFERVLGGIPLIWNSYGFRLDPDGVRATFHAAVVPVSSGLDDAVSRRKIAAEEARKIVERDLDALGLEKADRKPGEPSLAAYFRAPYVLWEARGTYKPGHEQVSWYYGVDAISGKIVRRSCSDGRVNAMAPSGHVPGPCDAIPAIPQEPSMLPSPYAP